MCGISLSEFGRMTPHELMLRVEAYNENMAIQYRQMLTQAYLTAYWHRVKRMPQLKKVLDEVKVRRQKQQTPEEMFAIVKSLNKQLSREGKRDGGRP